MAEPNGEIPLTGDPRVDAALRRIRGKFQDLEDAMLVQVTLERKMGERIKDHAEIIVQHDEMMAAHKERMAEHDRIWKRIDIALAEMTEKVHFLLNREMKREGGPEAA